MVRTRAQVLAVALTLAWTASRPFAQLQSEHTCPARETLPEHLRPLRCQMAARLAGGIVRSPTLRRLAERIGELNGIVYVKDGFYVNDRTKRSWSAVLSHAITRAGTHRILHVIVAPQSSDRL